MSHHAHQLADPTHPESIEIALRAEWWMNHGTSQYGACRPYGDDGQMQCCGINFLTHPIQDLHKWVRENRHETMIRSLQSIADPRGSDPDPRLHLKVTAAKVCIPTSKGGQYIVDHLEVGEFREVLLEGGPMIIERIE